MLMRKDFGIRLEILKKNQSKRHGASLQFERVLARLKLMYTKPTRRGTKKFLNSLVITSNKNKNLIHSARIRAR